VIVRFLTITLFIQSAQVRVALEFLT